MSITFKMDPEIKARWVAALRSGKYTQTRSELRNDSGHCCLGVLCDLYAKEVGMTGWDPKELGELTEDGDSLDDKLPGEDVCDWASINSSMEVAIDNQYAALYRHNDGDPIRGLPSRSFAEIAKAIEQQL